ncbi:MAG: 1-deoxy-D-xylulose-5-phosphate synthase, partial [Lachnospiraceae bacterium]|nr:1-deoxy-D-xylulose-5-phosphate synthase [Lachnospiraceae bacterium]
DTDYLNVASRTHKLIVTMEENVASGGFGEKIRAYVDDFRLKSSVLCIAIPDQFVTHGSVDKLLKELSMDAESVAERIIRELQR